MSPGLRERLGQGRVVAVLAMRGGVVVRRGVTVNPHHQRPVNGEVFEGRGVTLQSRRGLASSFFTIGRLADISVEL